jgi:hypothetical protein
MSAPEGPTGPPGDAPQPNGEKTPANGFAKLVAACSPSSSSRPSPPRW